MATDTPVAPSATAHSTRQATRGGASGGRDERGHDGAKGAARHAGCPWANAGREQQAELTQMRNRCAAWAPRADRRPFLMPTPQWPAGHRVDWQGSSVQRRSWEARPLLRNLEVFVAAAELGSFARAGRQPGITRSAGSRRVGDVDAPLGARPLLSERALP